MADIKTIRAEDLATPASGQGVILDVRTAMEHEEKHIALPHAHVPLDTLNPATFMQSQGLGHDAAVYILCRSGKRAAAAALLFATAGYANVYIVEGGIIACEDCGTAIKGYGTENAPQSAKKPVSLERQVRIAAGTIVAFGAVLGLVVAPAFTFIPLLVGCGLIFAGVTDRCGMALILAKAPWNTGCKSCGCGDQAK